MRLLNATGKAPRSEVRAYRFREDTSASVIDMDLSDPRRHLWAVITSIVSEKDPPGTRPPSVDRVKAITAVGRGTVQRIEMLSNDALAPTEMQDVRLGSIVQIARALRVPTWRLLHPGRISRAALELIELFEALDEDQRKALLNVAQALRRPQGWKADESLDFGERQSAAESPAPKAPTPAPTSRAQSKPAPAPKPKPHRSR